MHYHELVDLTYDPAFSTLSDLRWTPWVGQNYAKSGIGKRLMIVGESHYAKGTQNEVVEVVMKNNSSDKEFTREVIWESPVSGDWSNRTLDVIPQIFMGGKGYRREEFWQGIAFYNFVQRMMNYEVKERPSEDDFKLGWTVFYDVLKILKPDYCIFLGSAAHHRFWASMKKTEADFSDVKRSEKIGRCWSYRAGIKIAEKEIPLVFIQHPGRCFSAPAWHSYLSRELPAELSEIGNRYRTEE